jgi:hypothetical protein
MIVIYFRIKKLPDPSIVMEFFGAAMPKFKINNRIIVKTIRKIK